MKGKILGGMPYKAKESGKDRVYLFVQDLNPKGNIVGIRTQSLNCSAEVLPYPLKEMVGKNFVIDTDGGFGNDFYEVK